MLELQIDFDGAHKARNPWGPPGNFPVSRLATPPLGLPDPTQVFYIAQMLKAAIWERGFRLDSRLPITLPILHSLLEDSSQITGSEYQIKV